MNSVRLPFIRPATNSILLLMLLSGSLLAQKKNQNPWDDTPPGKEYIYKKSAGKDRRMEIYFPPDHNPAKSKVPGVILFHGGGWSGGSLAQFRPACAYFAKRGLVCATAEYQLLGKDTVQLSQGESKKRVCVTDAKSAIRWFKQHAQELGIDPSRIISGGGSAGGHISALATLNPGLNDNEDHLDIDTGVVAYLWFNPAFESSDSRDPEINALMHGKKDMPPSIVFFGDRDTWKPGWDEAHAKWRQLGVSNIDLRIAKGQEHGFFNKEPWRTAAWLEADKFLVKQGLLGGHPAATMPAGLQFLTSPTPEMK